jgi:para-aminobenzoate synthetase component I
MPDTSIQSPLPIDPNIDEWIGALIGVSVEPINLGEPFETVCGRFADIPGTVILLSGGDLDCGRHHILGVRPRFTFRCRHDKVRISSGSKEATVLSNPFGFLRHLTRRLALPRSVGPFPDPICAGLMGYLSYDLKDHIESLPKTSVDTMGLPHLYMAAPTVLLVHDKVEKHTTLCLPRWMGNETDTAMARSFFWDILKGRSRWNGPYSVLKDGIVSNFDHSVYLEAVSRIREYIAAGDVYQVNLSQRFETGFTGDSYTLFLDLYRDNPAPFFAYINGGDHQVVSTSPERFLLRRGNTVETRPIKGTRPRGTTPETDERMKTDLLESPKDDAELSMIVDLLRNDIGKVCDAGSVRVTTHKRLEAYQNVYHLVSIVEGCLERERDSVDLIFATFPGGSITGCPKIRSMEIIDELEPQRRHLYTGSIGYLSFHDTMDFSIAIRTAIVHKERIYFSVGGGIVYDSDPADEFEETLHKGQTLIKAFQGAEAPRRTQPHLWLNGRLLPEQMARIPVSHLGFQYGYGFFETIRVDGDRIHFLKDHLERFHAAWQFLFNTEPPDITWDTIIHQVIERNRLTKGTAAVKLLAAKGTPDDSNDAYDLLVTARPYIHRLTQLNRVGLDLEVYPYPRTTPLADHKTMNYLFYKKAGEWAFLRGVHEALILNPDGTVSETHTANILSISGGDVVLPVSAHVLPGVMERRVIDFFKEKGYPVRRQPMKPEDLQRADRVFLTNSLMGCVAVAKLGNNPLPMDLDQCRQVNQTLFGYPPQNQPRRIIQE